MVPKIRLIDDIVLPLAFAAIVAFLVFSLMNARPQECFSWPDTTGPDSMAMRTVCRTDLKKN